MNMNGFEKKRDVGNLVSVPFCNFGNNYYFTIFFLPNAMIAPKATSIATAESDDRSGISCLCCGDSSGFTVILVFIVIFAIVVFLCIRISDRICYKMLLDHFTFAPFSMGEYVGDSGFFEKLSCFCAKHLLHHCCKERKLFFL